MNIYCLEWYNPITGDKTGTCNQDLQCNHGCENA